MGRPLMWAKSDAHAGNWGTLTLMLVLFMLIVLACVVAGIIGFMVHGLVWLLIIATAVFVVTLAVGAWGQFRVGR